MSLTMCAAGVASWQTTPMYSASRSKASRTSVRSLAGCPFARLRLHETVGRLRGLPDVFVERAVQSNAAPVSMAVTVRLPSAPDN